MSFLWHHHYCLLALKVQEILVHSLTNSRIEMHIQIQADRLSWSSLFLSFVTSYCSKFLVKPRHGTVVSFQLTETTCEQLQLELTEWAQ